MASKPRSEWSPSYRRRVERAEAKGKSRQAARGHRVKEHVVRKEKALQEGRLTSSQRQSIRKFISQRDGEDRDDEDFFEWLDNDWSKFAALRDWVTSAHRQYVRENRTKTYVSRGLGFLIAEAMNRSLPSYQWMYYH